MGRSGMRVPALLAAAAITLALAGCVPEPAESGETPPATAGPTPSGTTTPTPEAREFAMPSECTDILSAETAAAFEADGLDLLGGPGGVYGEEYFVDPTPE